jgi:hypothetical protein
MRGKYPGVMPVKDFFQAVYQDAEFFTKHNITHIKAASLYFTPCDEHGNTLVVANPLGQIIDGYLSAGSYPCAAQFYDALQLEPRPVMSAFSTLAKPPPPKSSP